MGNHTSPLVTDPDGNKYALGNKWSKAKDYKKPFDHFLEDSEQWLRVRRLDMGDLLKLGIANEMDFMSKALMNADPKDDQKAKDAVADAVTKADNFGKMERMINMVVLNGVMEPKLFPVPEHENARQEGLLYIDEVPWEDRMDLFSVIFETEGLSDFREEQEPGVGNVADDAELPLSTDGPVGVRPDNSEGVLL